MGGFLRAGGGVGGFSRAWWWRVWLLEDVVVRAKACPTCRAQAGTMLRDYTVVHTHHTLVHVHIHTQNGIGIRIPIPIPIQIHIHGNIHIHIHIRIHMHIHVHSYPYSIRVHAHLHIHIHIYAQTNTYVSLARIKSYVFLWVSYMAPYRFYIGFAEVKYR